MIRINKRQRDLLLSKGYSFGGFEPVLHATNHKTYYATERRDVLEVLGMIGKKKK